MDILQIRLNAAKDGSLIRLGNRFAWKNGGNWHVLNQRTGTSGWGEMSEWNAVVLATSELDMTKIQLVDLILG